ncbi:flagellar hook-length control protein FliK [Roseibium sp. SCP14]|uniref:flagellar hook-length control protein FliK n=1 Tax=Roseibium sp. SCP14 TaxID=3141375 RepID=UPI0033380B13
MVETVSTQPLPQNSGGSAVVSKLEPGAELHAKVEANLPGGVVRLATTDAKLDLRIPQPLPVGSEVTITVSGTKQQPEIQLSTVKAQSAPQSGTAPPTQTGSTTAGQVQETAGQSVSPQAHATYKPAPIVASLVQALDGTTQASPQGPSSPGSTSGVESQAGRVSAAPAQPLPNSLRTQPSTTQTPPLVSGTPAAKTVGQPKPTSSGAPTTAASSSQPPTSGVGGSSGQPTSVSTQAASTTSGPTVPDAVRTGTGQQSTLSGHLVNAAGALQQISTPPKAGVSQQAPMVGSGSQSGSNGTRLQPSNSSQAISQGSVPNSAGSVSSSGAQSPAGTSVQFSSKGEPVSASPSAPAISNSASQSVSSTAARPTATQSAVSQAPTPQGPGQLPQSAGTVQAGPVSQSPGTQVPTAQPPVTQPIETPTLQGQSSPNVKPAGDFPKGPTAALPSGVTSSSSQSGGSTGNSVQPRFSADPGVPVTGRFLGNETGGFRTPPRQPYPALQSGAQPHFSGVQSLAPSNPVRQLAQTFQQPLAEQQAGLSGLFTQIGNLTAAQSSGRVSVPDPVVKAMQQILGLRLNTSQALNGGDVQQAVRLSGQFREAQAFLPGGGQPTGFPDLKSALLSFKSLLQQFGAETETSRPANQPAPPSRHGAPQGQAQQPTGGYVSGSAQQNLQSLLKETDAALARLRITQLANTGLMAEEGPQVSSRPADVVVELPLSLGQETAVLQMQIGRDGGGRDEEEEGEPAWRLRFALDLTATGPLEAAISLRGGGTFASLWVDRKETYDNLNSVRETMEAAFADAGLDLQEFRLVRGLPPKTAARYGALIDRQS